MGKAGKELVRLLRSESRSKTKAYDTQAEVVRIEGSTAWVHIPGGVDETPVQMTIDCKVGDTVQARVGGGTAWLVGNKTAPPTDDTEAIVARLRAELAEKKAVEAYSVASSAQQYAEDNAEDMARIVVQINADIADIQEQIDGSITSWFYTVDPSMNLPPVALDPQDPDNTGWDTDEEKNNHLGDLYYNTDSGKTWRFVYQDGAFQWVAVVDSDVATALEKASKAQDTADSKRRVFVATPTPPYDVGDLWVQGSSGDIMRCATAKATGQSYQASDWVKASKYTDDSSLTTFISGTYASDKTAMQGLIDGKAETWYQSADPSTGWSTADKSKHEGDLWYRTTDSKTFYWNGSAWQEQEAPDAVFDAIDGKAQIFTTQPKPPYNVGDLWFSSASSDIMTCITARASGSYTASDWQKRNKYTNDARANEAYALAESASGKADTLETEMVTNVEVQYAKSTSSSTAPTSGWSTDSPVWEAGKYIWQRTVTTVNGEQIVSNTSCIQGAKGDTGGTGAKGDKGDKGDAGSKGDTGVGISKITPQYNLSTSNTTANGTWSNTPAAYVNGRYYWTRSYIEYDDGTTGYAPSSAGVLDNALTTMNSNAYQALVAAGNAEDIAEATSQHFWSDTDGVHISSEADAPTATRNSLWNSLGMLFRKGSNYILGILTGTNPSVTIYDGSGNADSNVVAKFGSDEIRMGRASGARSVITSTGMDVYNSSNQKKASFGSTQYIYGGSGTYPYTRVNGSGVSMFQNANNHADVTSSGLAVTQGGVEVASFGSTARVGKPTASNTGNVYIDDDSVDIRKGATVLSSFDADGLKVYDNGVKVADFGNNIELGRVDGDAWDYLIDISGSEGRANIEFATQYGGQKGANITFDVKNDDSLSIGTTGCSLELYSAGGIEMSCDSGIAMGTAFGNILLNAPYGNVCFGNDKTPHHELFVPTSHTLLSAVSIAASNYTSGTKTFTKSGYYPLGIVGRAVSGTGNSFCIPYQLRLSSISEGSATVSYGIRNFASSAATLTMTIDILWVKVV